MRWTDWGAWPIWGAILRMIGFTAAVGAGTGIAFSTYVATNFRRTRPEDLSSVRTALGGGLVILLVGLVIYTASGAPAGIGFAEVLPLLSWGTLLGGGMGYASLAAARRVPPGPSSSGPGLDAAQPLTEPSTNSSDTRLELTR